MKKPARTFLQTKSCEKAQITVPQHSSLELLISTVCLVELTSSVKHTRTSAAPMSSGSNGVVVLVLVVRVLDVAVDVVLVVIVVDLAVVVIVTLVVVMSSREAKHNFQPVLV